MNQKFLILILILVSACAAIYWGMKWPMRNQIIRAEESLMERSDKIKEALIEEPREVVEEAPAQNAISEECQNLWNRILTEKVDRNAQNFVPPDLSVCKNVPAEFNAATQEFEEACRAVGLSESQKQNCFSKYLVYRATISDWQTRDQKIEEISDEKLLLDKLLSSFSSKDMKRALELAERLHEKLPDFYEPMKAILAAKMMIFASSETAKDEAAMDETIQSLERTLQRAEEFQQNDVELVDMRAFVDTRGFKDLDKLQNFVEDLRARGAPSELVAYYDAARAWRMNEKDRAKEIVDQALQVTPQNARLAQLKEDMATKKPGEPVFSFSINFNFED